MRPIALSFIALGLYACMAVGVFLSLCQAFLQALPTWLRVCIALSLAILLLSTVFPIHYVPH